MKNISAGGGSFEVLEEGTYVARVCRIIDLGIQQTEDLKTGKPNGWRPKMSVSFELPTETIEVNGEDKPRWLSKISTVSKHEKSFLFQLVKATGLRIEKLKSINELLGQPLMVEVGLTSGGKNKIVSVSRLIKGMQVDELSQEPVAFDFDEPEEELLEKFPDFIKDLLTKSQNYKGSKVEAILNTTKEVEEEEEEEDCEVF